MNTKIKYLLPVVITGLLNFNPAGCLHAGEVAEPVPLVNVHVTTITHMELHRELTFYGVVVPQQASESRHAASSSVAASSGGQVIAVPAIEGNEVHRNDVLVRLNSRQADAATQRARALLKQTKSAFNRQQKLARLDDTSARKLEQAEQQLAQAEAALKEAQTRRALLDIRSPLDGTVLAVLVRPGEAVLAGDPVVEIQDIGRLAAEVQIPASQLADLHTGQAASVLATNRSTQGKVSFISMRVNPATGTAPARIILPAGSGLYSGQFVQARVIVEKHTGLVVPVKSVRHQPDGSGLIATVSGDQVKLQPVTLGIEDSGQVEISGNGIREGLQVVTREAYGLPDNAYIRIISD